MREDHAAHLFVYDYMQDLTDWPHCITEWLEATRDLDQEVAEALASVADRSAAFWLTLP